jgi:hypothetical protein
MLVNPTILASSLEGRTKKKIKWAGMGGMKEYRGRRRKKRQ